MMDWLFSVIYKICNVQKTVPAIYIQSKVTRTAEQCSHSIYDDDDDVLAMPALKFNDYYFLGYPTCLVGIQDLVYLVSCRDNSALYG